MSGTAPSAAHENAPGNVRMRAVTKGSFGPGNIRPGPGRPRGSKTKKTAPAGIVPAALAARAWGVIETMLSSPSPRWRFESARLTIAYVYGTPRQSITLEGGLSDLATEIRAALARVRQERELAKAATPVAEVLPALEGRNGDEKCEKTPPIEGNRNNPETTGPSWALLAAHPPAAQEPLGAAIVPEDASLGAAPPGVVAGAVAREVAVVAAPVEADEEDG